MSRAIPLPPLWAFGPVTGYLYLYHVHLSMYVAEYELISSALLMKRLQELFEFGG
jgi:hypothetical protein